MLKRGQHASITVTGGENAVDQFDLSLFSSLTNPDRDACLVRSGAVGKGTVASVDSTLEAGCISGQTHIPITGSLSQIEFDAPADSPYYIVINIYKPGITVQLSLTTK